MAAPISQRNSRDPWHEELVEHDSEPNKQKLAEEELKEAEQRIRRDSGELEMEGLLPSVNYPGRQVQIEEWKKEAQQFETDFSDMEMKIHRFPGSLQGLDRRYIFPMAVSIGLYHHNSSNLQEMEKVKRVAAHHFVRESGHTFEEMYAAVFSVIGTARRFYDCKVEVGDAEFADIMFIDGCFLLQYMLGCTRPGMVPESLLSWIHSNQYCINNDIMLLENQLPWLVIDTLRRFSNVPVEDFIRLMGCLFQYGMDMDRESAVLGGSYMPPHLLGLLWSFKTGDTNNIPRRAMSRSISAMELGEIGIKLTASKKAKFTEMGVNKGFLSSEIFLTPLMLDNKMSCWLVNLVAFEVSVGMTTCTRKNGYQMKAVVCSYIAVLAMLMDREEDVHELRSKRLVQGELTNKEALDFFKMLVKPIPPGPHYRHFMGDIESYKVNRWMWIKMHRFVYKNFKAIITVFSIIGVLVGIFKTLLSLKKQ